MLGYYKYTRKQIVEMILNSPKTTDGFYYMYNFPVLNLMRGKIIETTQMKESTNMI